MRKTLASVALGLSLLVSGVCGGQGALAAESGRATTGNAIVATALQYLGRPYTQSGTNPETGFSDLGFVRYVYARNGISLHIGLARPAYHRLFNGGARIAWAQLQPGDIVFFRNTLWAGLSHVGIYVGEGKFVHAEYYGTGVRLTSFRHDPKDGSYWTWRYVTAVRPAHLL